MRPDLSHTSIEPAGLVAEPLGLLNDAPSLAVLPFAEIDGNSQRHSAGAWLAADLVHGLSKIRQVAVIGTQFASVFREDEGAPDDIRRSLGTRYLVCGSIRRRDQHAEVRVQLLDTASGRVLWTNIFRTAQPSRQSEIDDALVQTMTTCLAVKIEAIERARFDLDRIGGASIAGLAFKADNLVRRMQRSAAQRARRLAERALHLQPFSAHAHAVLSRSHHLDWRFAWVDDPDKAMELAIDYAERAIELDPIEASGHAALGISRLHQRKHEAALAACEQALNLNPSDPDIMADLGLCLAHSGDPSGAIETLALAIHLKPESADIFRLSMANAFGVLADFPSVIATVLAMTDQAEGNRLLVASYAHLGLEEQAKHCAASVMTVHPNFALDHWRNVVPTKDTDRTDMFIDGLAKGGLR